MEACRSCPLLVTGWSGCAYFRSESRNGAIAALRWCHLLTGLEVGRKCAKFLVPQGSLYGSSFVLRLYRRHSAVQGQSKESLGQRLLKRNQACICVGREYAHRTSWQRRELTVESLHLLRDEDVSRKYVARSRYM